MSRLFSGALLTLVAGACASHVDRPTPPAAQPAPAAQLVPAEDASVEAVASDQSADDEGLICRREVVTGSHFPVKVCTTREQREEMRRASDALLRDTLRQPTSPGPVTGQGGN